MMDIIVTWPIHMDYPIFRQELASLRKRSNKIIIAFSDHNMGQDLSQFVKNTLPGVIFVEPRTVTGRDWRDIAVNDCLKYSDGTHVLFMEQDFLVSSMFYLAFWDIVDHMPPHLAGWMDDTGRLHPSFLYVQKTLLNQTSYNFAANPPEWDHFGKVSQELLAANNGQYSDLKIYGDEWIHLGGLTQNYNLIMKGEPPNYNLEMFYWYNKNSRKAKVEQIKEYIDLSLRAEGYKNETE